MKLWKNKKRQEMTEEILEPRIVAIPQACEIIRDMFIKESNDDWEDTIKEAEAGNMKAVKQAKSIICSLLERELIVVPGMNAEQTAQKIFDEGWGLAELADLYNDTTVEEITVVPAGSVFVTRQGVTSASDIFLTPERIEALINRLVPHNERGSSLNWGSPIQELTRSDHTRLTALCWPSVKGYAFILRKHDTMHMTVDEFMRLGTFDEKTWKILSFLTRMRRNMVICGPPNSGKTTLLEMLLGELPEHLSIRIIDQDSEIRASKLYPNRNIMEMEAHPEVDASLKKLFVTTLRLSPDVYVVPEFRDAEVALEVINAGSRSRNVMSTSHHTTQSVVRNTVMLLMDGGMSEEMAMEQVTQTFHIIIEMFVDPNPLRGTRKIIGITELAYDSEKGKVTYRPLIKWYPSTSDYLGPGEWKIENAPSNQAYLEMQKYNTTVHEIDQVFKIQR